MLRFDLDAPTTPPTVTQVQLPRAHQRRAMLVNGALWLAIQEERDGPVTLGVPTADGLEARHTLGADTLDLGPVSSQAGCLLVGATTFGTVRADEATLFTDDRQAVLWWVTAP